MERKSEEVEYGVQTTGEGGVGGWLVDLQEKKTEFKLTNIATPTVLTWLRLLRYEKIWDHIFLSEVDSAWKRGEDYRFDPL